MNVIARLCCLSAAVVLLALPLGAGEPNDARKIIDKAIKAHGGAEALAKYPASTIKMKGRYFGMGDGIDYTGSWSGKYPDRVRFEIMMTIANQQFTIIKVLKGDKGWQSFNGETKDLPKEDVAELREGLHVHDLRQLVGLGNKEIKLSVLGEVQVDKRPALGVHVEQKGWRDVNLFFDKQSGLIVKTETRGKDPMLGDQEFNSETYYRDYKKVGNLMVPYKVEIRRDNKLFVDGETVEFTPVERLEDSIFARP